MSTQFVMKNNFFLTFFTVLFVICIKNEANSNDVLPEDLPHRVDHICKDDHWQRMRFDAIKCESGDIMKFNISSGSAMDKLKIFPHMMACGYGQELFDFLWLTVVTGDECRDLSERLYAEDCWTKLKASLDNGVHAVRKQLRVLQLVHSSDKSITPSPYFGILLSIQKFLADYEPRTDSSEGVLDSPRQILILANVLERIFNTYCEPNLQFFIKENLMEQHASQLASPNPVSNIYEFYVNKLNSYITYIVNHLVKLGFHYDVNTKKISYTTPTQSD